MIVNIIVPKSNTSNDIYSFSEVIYMAGYLQKHEIVVSVHLADIPYLKSHANDFSKNNNVLVLMWDGQSLVEWLDAYETTVNTKTTILYGLTAQIYGEYIKRDYSFINCVISSYSYDELIICLNKGISNGYQHPTMSELMYPDVTIDVLRYLPMMPIISSRGCPHQCNFCAVGCTSRSHNETYQFRDADSIYQEIIQHIENGRAVFYFVDSCFFVDNNLNKKRIIELCNIIIENQLDISFYIETRVDSINQDIFTLLKKAGLKRVLMGIENIHEKVQERYNKRIHKNDIIKAIKILRELRINVDLTMITFDPMTSKEELLSNVEFILENNLFDFIDPSGVFRRLILLPNNKINFCKSEIVFDLNEATPKWLNESYNYRLIDNNMCIFEKILRAQLCIWKDCQNEIISRTKNIRKKRIIKQKLSNCFLQTVFNILSDCIPFSYDSLNNSFNELYKNIDKEFKLL